jgi:hypothetical protein
MLYMRPEQAVSGHRIISTRTMYRRLMLERAWPSENLEHPGRRRTGYINEHNCCYMRFCLYDVRFGWFYIFIVSPNTSLSRDSSVGIATGYGLDDQGAWVRVPVGKKIFTSPYRPDRLWGPPNFLQNGYLGFFPGGKAAGAWSWPLTSN